MKHLVKSIEGSTYRFPSVRFILVALSLGASGCHNLEQSRQIDNPAVGGRTIALQVCSNCHSVNGISVSPTFPKLAAQPQEYLVNQLTDFKAHQRSDPNARRFMWGFTHLSEAQIEQLAAYFSSQPPPAPRASADHRLIESGRTIFLLGIPDKGVPACSACHGLHGEGAGGFPRLAGQYADYVEKQILVFRSAGLRPRGEVMKVIADNLSDRDIRAVAAFMEAFPAGAEAAASPTVDH
ncbi:cytochrome c4 [Paraburkholderia sp. UYCP14C]|uniref:c-type cytochrome n=1 Tax=Paraburkholderia sp. UYCP14C TaxID=2511130 RepID=UPI0010215401|nr:c-type cytochrome [Paraburkholderia sp. UYCP14C]RZF25696.1 cytochrome c4 [Paraburkholderia sp. UYCP14C]